MTLTYVVHSREGVPSPKLALGAALQATQSLTKRCTFFVYRRGFEVMTSNRSVKSPRVIHHHLSARPQQSSNSPLCVFLLRLIPRIVTSCCLSPPGSTNLARYGCLRRAAAQDPHQKGGRDTSSGRQPLRVQVRERDYHKYGMQRKTRHIL